MTDMVISNGLIVDGSGAPPVVGSIRIEDERIAAITPGDTASDSSAPLDVSKVIDASGLMVTPGFMDIHSHSDHTFLVDPRTFSAVKQGVTFELVGNCGFGCFPISDPKLALNKIYAYHDVEPISWRTAGEYFESLEAKGPAINIGSLVPNGQLRLAVVGEDERPATPEEQTTMLRLLEESLEEGAWGLSNALDSGEERWMSEEEVTEQCRRVASAGGLYATHTRDRAEKAVEAIEEAIRIADHSGVMLEISHLIPDGGQEDLERCLCAVDAGAERGIHLNFDMHTRLFGIGYLYGALPPAYLVGSPSEVAGRLRDPERRQEIRDFKTVLSGVGDWDRVILLDNEVWPEYSRQSIAAIANVRGTDSIDAVCDLLAKTADDLARLWVVLLTFTEEEQQTSFGHPLCVPASDAAALALDGPLAASTFHGAYSWAAWFYRYMVRDRRLLSPEAAVHKLTEQPASVIGLKDRGLIRPGAFADIAIFDPETFADQETIWEPNQPAVGMKHVLVNGKLVLENGALTGERSGRVLRRG